MQPLATVRVAITALSDAQREREATLRITEDLNRGIAAQYGMRLETYIWEIDVGAKLQDERTRRPAALLDEIEECDVAIAIFCIRLGAPATGTSSEQEFHRAYESWKKSGKPHLLVYFSQKPLTPTSEDADTWERMQRFRREFPPYSLRWDYKSTSEFEHLVRSHLTEYLVSRSAVAPVAQSQTPSHSGENASQQSVSGVRGDNVEPTPPSAGSANSPQRSGKNKHLRNLVMVPRRRKGRLKMRSMAPRSGRCSQLIGQG